MILKILEVGLEIYLYYSLVAHLKKKLQLNILKKVFNHKAINIQWIFATSFLFTGSTNQFLFSQSSIGIEIGRSYSKFEVTESAVKLYEYSSEFDHKGFLITGIYTYAFNKYFSVTSGIGYIQRGTIVTRDYGIVGYDKFSLNYLSLPLTVGVSPIKLLTFSGGLSTSYLIKAKSFFGKDRYMNDTGYYKRIDIGWKTGFTINFRNFLFNGAYFQSLKPIWVIDYPPAIAIKDTKHYNRSLELSLGYQFNLKQGD